MSSAWASVGIGNAAPVRLPGVSLVWSAGAAEKKQLSGVPLFVGFVQARDANIGSAAPPRALALQRWDDWPSLVGHAALGYLDYAVKGFFENGGARCWVWPLESRGDASAAQLKARLTACFEPGSPLEDLSEPDLVCVPDACFGALGASGSAVLEVQRSVLAHCTRMNNRLAVLDCLPRSAAGPHERIARLAGTGATAHGAAPNSERAPAQRSVAGHAANGAVYWPWIAVPPLARHASQVGATRFVPPCGHVAGVYARIDAAEGRHKAPANELLEGVFDVDEQADEQTLADLNDDGVNCLRVLPGRGVLVCGARTLSDLPAWRYVNVRRVVLGLARWAELGMLALVMDTNGPALWERIRQRVSAYCLALYRQGALRGDAPEQAFFVKCDAETNPREAREIGRVVCEVGLAAAVPAEFIVVQLLQSADGAVLAG